MKITWFLAGLLCSCALLAAPARPTTAGTAARQEFPVDAESRALFEREGSKASVTNTWAMAIEPGKTFVYELARPGRLFRVEFDLTRPVALPPLPWGTATER